MNKFRLPEKPFMKRERKRFRIWILSLKKKIMVLKT